MRGRISEYILKGIFLGLLLNAGALQPLLPGTALVVGSMLGGLLLAMLLGLVGLWRSGLRVGRSPAALFLYLALENPRLVYAGVIGGLAVSVLLLERLHFTVPGATDQLPLGRDNLQLALVGGGAAVGLVFALVRQISSGVMRVGVCLVVAAGLAAGLMVVLSDQVSPEWRADVGLHLLVGLPFFYLLTFAGYSEESEIEIATVCAGVVVGVWLMRYPEPVSGLVVLLPLVAYFVYTFRIMTGVRVFKHVLRAFSFAQGGAYREALLSYRRALQLNPRSKLALRGQEQLHEQLKLDEPLDAQTFRLLDADLCMKRVARLLAGDGPPSASDLHTAEHLLGQLATHRPELRPRLEYWFVVAGIHRQQYDEAAQRLAALLDPANWPTDDPQRDAILLAAWALALQSHPEIVHRLGVAELAKPGRRLDAIRVAELALAEASDDPGTLALREQFYAGLTLEEYRAGLAPGQARPAQAFNHAYALQLGRDCLARPDQFKQGVAYMEMAAHGLPEQRTIIYKELADAHEKAGDHAGMLYYLEQVKAAGQTLGPANLSSQAREAYFTAIHRLAHEAIARGELDRAIDELHHYTEYEKSGIETLRTLADLYERKGDALKALRVIDKALEFFGASKDADLMERKDRYYASVNLDEVARSSEGVRRSLDWAYCLEKGKLALERGGDDLDTLEWASHLAQLATILKPGYLPARLLRARTLLRRGESMEALRELEDIREAKPSGGDEQDAWFAAVQILARLYLDEYDRPDLALACLNDFKASPKSGADTFYHMGRAYERLGNAQAAIRAYEQVTVYTKHPLYYDALQAINRLKSPREPEV